jgi:hypothetical protein
MKPDSFRARNLRRRAQNALENLRRYAQATGVKDADGAAERAAREIHGLDVASEGNGVTAASRRSAGAAGAVPHRLDDRTREQLYDRAKELDIAGRSQMSKDELIAAIRDAQ